MAQGGVQVEDAAACVGGQLAGGDLTAGDSLTQLLLSALGIPGVQDLHHHGSVQLSDGLVEHVGRILLLASMPMYTCSTPKHLASSVATLDHLLRTLQHGAVVAVM